ncbi:MAG: hypothetical protein FWC85_01570 [Elusimicrobia bacterium]|nr:hypothetical protein [Elusimicrobiota bacterium]
MRIISKTTGQDVYFSNFAISPLRRQIRFQNVYFTSIDASAEEITIRISPLNYLKNFRYPASIAQTIKILGLNIDLKNLTSGDDVGASETLEPSNINERTFSLPFRNTNIILKRSFIYAGSERFENVNLTFNLRNISKLHGNFNYRNMPFNVLGEVFKNNGKIFNNITLSSAGVVYSEISIKGYYLLHDGSLEQAIYFETLRSRGFDLSHSLGLVRRSYRALSFNFSGDFGDINLKLPATAKIDESASLSGRVNLEKIRPDLKGILDIKLARENGKKYLYIDINELSYRNFNLGSGNKRFSREYGAINAVCVLASGFGLNLTVNPRGAFNAAFTENRREIGRLWGNFRTSQISADVQNFDISRLQPKTPAPQRLHGIMTLEGSVDESGGQFDLKVLNLRSYTVQRTNLYGRLVRQYNEWFLNINNSDESFKLETDIRNNIVQRADINFQSLDLNNTVSFFRPGANFISGTAQGRLKYLRGANLEADIIANNGRIGRNNFDTLLVDVDLSRSAAYVEKILLTAQDRRFYAHGLIGFTSQTPESYFIVSAENIELANRVNLNADMNFRGYLGNGGTVHGHVYSELLDISGLRVENFFANAQVGPRSIKVKNISAGNAEIAGYLNIRDRNLSGRLECSNLSIEGVQQDLKGYLNANVSIAGTVANPDININARLNNAYFNDVAFRFAAQGVYRNLNFILNSANLSGRGRQDRALRISAQGNVWPKANLNVNFENLSHRIVNRFVGFRSPFEGMLFGSGIVGQNEAGALKARVDVSSRNFNIKTVQVNSLEGLLKIDGSKITLQNAAAQIQNSRINVRDSSFDIESGLYNFNAGLLNVRVGPVNVFGNINVVGRMTRRRGGSTYMGSFEATDLWLNQSNVGSLKFAYALADRELTVIANTAQRLRVNGDISFKEQVVVRDLSIIYGTSTLAFSSTFEGGNFNITSETANVNLDTIAALMGWRFNFTGRANARFSAQGTPTTNSSSLHLESQGAGTFENVPFDSFVLDATSENNIATIRSARVHRRNGVSAQASGTFPLVLNSSIQSDNRYNIAYELTDTRLSLLGNLAIGNLASGFITPRAGTLRLSGTVSGTNEDIKHNARLSISGGSFNASAYTTRVRDLNVEAELKDNVLTLNRFYARAGNGRVNISGDMGLTNVFMPTRYNLRAVTQDRRGISATIPQLPLPGGRAVMGGYSSADFILNISLTGEASSPLLAGDVTLENARVSFPPPERDYQAPMPYYWARTRLDLNLTAGRSTRFENAMVQADLTGTLHLTGRVDDPRAAGILETERGRISYLGHDFAIDSARIEVTPERMFVSGDAHTRFFTPNEREPEILRLHVERSEVTSLNIHFSSANDPSMASSDVLARITRTEEGAEMAPGGTDFMVRQQLIRLFTSNVAAPIAQNILRRTGVVDNFRVRYVNDPARIADEANPTFAELMHGTTYSFERNITPSFLLGYNITFDQPDDYLGAQDQRLDLRHEIEVRYRLNRWLALRGSFELERDGQVTQPERRVSVEHRLRFGGGSRSPVPDRRHPTPSYPYPVY